MNKALSPCNPTNVLSKIVEDKQVPKQHTLITGLDIGTFFQKCNFPISYINIRTFFVI